MRESVLYCLYSHEYRLNMTFFKSGKALLSTSNLLSSLKILEETLAPPWLLFGKPGEPSCKYFPRKDHHLCHLRSLRGTSLVRAKYSGFIPFFACAYGSEPPTADSKEHIAHVVACKFQRGMP